MQAGPGGHRGPQRPSYGLSGPCRGICAGWAGRTVFSMATLAIRLRRPNGIFALQLREQT